jgi:hypothetical protein
MARRKWNLSVVQQIMNGEQPFVQSGYSAPEVRHKNGDVWEDSKKKKWMKKNGAIIRVNDQADSIRELIKKRCSICGTDLGLFGDRLDEKVYSKTGKCLNCLQAEHTEMVCNGTFQEYSDKMILKNKLSTAKEFKKNVLETIDFLKKDDCKIEMVHSNGTVTTFVGAQNERLLKESEIDLEKVDKLIVELEAKTFN